MRKGLVALIAVAIALAAHVAYSLSIPRHIDPSTAPERNNLADVLLFLMESSKYLALLNTKQALSISTLLRESSRKVFRCLAIALVFVAVATSIATLVNIVGGGDENVFTWIYRDSEVWGFNKLISLSNGLSVCGDDKVKYFASMRKAVSVEPVIRFALRGETPTNCLTIVYRDNMRFGFVSSVNVYKAFTQKLFVLSKVFDNGCVYGFR